MRLTTIKKATKTTITTNISELQWLGAGENYLSKHIIVYSGGWDGKGDGECETGVGVILEQHGAKTLK